MPLSGREAPMLVGIDTAEYQAALRKVGSVVPDLAYTNGALVDVGA